MSRCQDTPGPTPSRSSGLQGSHQAPFSTSSPLAVLRRYPNLFGSACPDRVARRSQRYDESVQVLPSRGDNAKIRSLIHHVYYRVEHEMVRGYAVLDCRWEPSWTRTRLSCIPHNGTDGVALPEVAYGWLDVQTLITSLGKQYLPGGHSPG